MSGIADIITGKSASLARAAQEKQAAALAAEKDKVAAVEAGQARVMNSGGASGLLAYVDPTDKLKKTFG